MRHTKTLLSLLLGLALASCGGGSSPPAPATTQSETVTGGITVQVHYTPSIASSVTAPAVSGFAVRIVTPRMATRRIEPGTIPDTFIPPEPVALPQGGWRIAGLPAGLNLLLEVDFDHTLDLATGAVLAAGAPQRAAALFPVVAPADGNLAADVTLALAANPAGGYCLIGRLECAGSAGQSLTTQIDYHSGTVSRDSNGDGDFGDEPRLADPQHLGVSLPLLERLDAENGAPAAAPTLFTALVDSVDSAAGELRVSHLQAPTASGPGANQTLQFAEDSFFSQRRVTQQAQTEQGLAPQSIQPGSRIILSCNSLRNSDGTAQLWLDRALALRLDLPPDSVVAVPLKPAARAGEVVPVTVYVNHAAHPLHAVDHLRISFSADDRYLAGSLDPGDIGGGRSLADGVWTGLSAANFSLNDTTRTASGSDSPGLSHVDLSLAPGGAAEVDNATGALCNFQLVCHAATALGVESRAPDGPVTTYTGLDGVSAQWSNCLTPDQPQLAVEGLPVVLSLADPPHFGAGTDGLPYVIAPGAALQFRLMGGHGEDLTQSPLTRFVLSRNGSDPLDLPGGRYAVPADFGGPLHVTAEFDGLYCLPASEVSLFAEQMSGFSLHVHEAETAAFGGSAAGWSLGFARQSDVVRALVAPLDGRNLKGVYFDLDFDPRLYYPVELSATTSWPVYPLVPPSQSLLTQTVAGQLRTGVSEAQPQSAAGCTGSLPLVEIRFKRRAVGMAPVAPLTPAPPNYPCAQLSADVPAQQLSWQPFIMGDFNQDGRVDLALDGPGALGDWTALCINYGVTGFAPDSAADVIDRTWSQPRKDFTGGDGKVESIDAFTLIAHRGCGVDAWRLYYAAARGAYPQAGRLLATVPFSAGRADPPGTRLWFHWQAPAGLSGGVYWVCPVLGNQEGAPSLPLAVP